MRGWVLAITVLATATAMVASEISNKLTGASDRPQVTEATATARTLSAELTAIRIPSTPARISGSAVAGSPANPDAYVGDAQTPVCLAGCAATGEIPSTPPTATKPTCIAGCYGH